MGGGGAAGKKRRKEEHHQQNSEVSSSNSSNRFTSVPTQGKTIQVMQYAKGLSQSITLYMLELVINTDMKLIRNRMTLPQLIYEVNVFIQTVQNEHGQPTLGRSYNLQFLAVPVEH